MDNIKDKGSSLVKAGFIITALVLFSKLFGFIRETFIANYFGTSKELDIFLLSMLVSGLVAGACKEGLNNTIIPVLAKYLEGVEDREERKSILGNIFLICTLLLIALSLLGVISAPFIAKIFSSSLGRSNTELLIVLTEISFLSVVFSGLTGLLSGSLNYFNSFSLPALSGLLLNFTTILVMVVMHQRWGIYALALGTMLGNVGPVLVMALSARYKVRLPRRLDFKHPAVRTLGILLLPLFIGNAVDQINYLVDRVFAVGLPTGSISALNYATKVLGLPITIFAATIATVTFPTMSRHAAANDKSGLAEISSTGLRISLALSLPTTLCLYILKEPLIKILFQRGAFNAEDTSITALAFGFYLIGLFAYVAKVIAVRTLYSLQAMRTTVVVGAINVIFNIIFILLFVKSMGIAGLALATSLATVVELGILLYIIYLRFGQPKVRVALLDYLKILGALFFMGLSSSYFFYFFKLTTSLSTVQTLIQMLLFSFCTFLVYLTALAMFKFPEVEFLQNVLVKNKWVKKTCG